MVIKNVFMEVLPDVWPMLIIILVIIVSLRLTYLITKHKKSDKFLNYHKEHIVDILKTDALRGFDNDEVETFVVEHLSDYDEL